MAALDLWTGLMMGPVVAASRASRDVNKGKMGKSTITMSLLNLKSLNPGSKSHSQNLNPNPKSETKSQTQKSKNPNPKLAELAL